jgi:formylglycine-generating enzyme required for sulfatase activity
MDFCERLSGLPREQQAGRVYRLPTEAEWEYASRGDNQAQLPVAFGLSLSSNQANFDGAFPFGDGVKGPFLGKTAPASAVRAPTSFGLQDMHGNVWEWCADWYDKDYYRTNPRQDPRGPEAGPENARVLRGGAWNSEGRYCRSACRHWHAPGYRDGAIGLRVLCEPAQQGR